MKVSGSQNVSQVRLAVPDSKELSWERSYMLAMDEKQEYFSSMQSSENTQGMRRRRSYNAVDRSPTQIRGMQGSAEHLGPEVRVDTDGRLSPVLIEFAGSQVTQRVINLGDFRDTDDSTEMAAPSLTDNEISVRLAAARVVSAAALDQRREHRAVASFGGGATGIPQLRAALIQIRKAPLV